ncbi:hypothetical protein ACS0TY_001776 [Phlomoides rotata]
MGNCRSCKSESTVTAKLILADGNLQEFSWPVKVSLLLKQDSDGFICSADDMDFGEFAAAMGGDEVLQPGELYFELPSGWRNQRLQAEDMAVLALKASVALASKSRDGDDRIVSCCCCASRKAERVSLFPEKERPLLAAEGGGACAERGRGSGGVGGAKGSKFVASLSAIVED